MNPFRIFDRLYAFFGGYFWLPCPVCRRKFGGHEATQTVPLIVQQEDGQHAYGVCSEKCSIEAQRQNDVNGFMWPQRL